MPGVEIVEIETSAIGYTGTALAPMGQLSHADTVEAALRDAEAAGVDVLVGVYHGDHREFAGREADWPFALQNYMELLGERAWALQGPTGSRNSS